VYKGEQKVNLAHKIALDPTEKQRQYFVKACGVSRFSYNWALQRWNESYLAGEKPTPLKVKKQFNQIKHKQFPWIGEIHKDANQEPINNLGTAFTKFFKKQTRHPTFKKKGFHDSFYVSNDKFYLDNKRVHLPKIGWIHLREQLRFNGKIMSAVVSRTANRWFVSLAVQVNQLPYERTNHGTVGIDLGIKHAATLSTGEVFDSPKPLKNRLRQLRRLQRQLARRVKGSNRRNLTKQRIAKLYAKISYIRSDFLHKLTTSLVKRFDRIVIEDLNVKGMMKNRRLARAISDIGFGEFRRQLEYKSKITESEIGVADRWYPSTQTCSKCGCVREVKLTLADRVFVCEKCSHTIDRDLNASINLSRIGSIQSNAQGHFVRPFADIEKAGMDELRTNQCSLVNTI
jgi:putative transposase